MFCSLANIISFKLLLSDGESSLVHVTGGLA